MKTKLKVDKNEIKNLVWGIVLLLSMIYYYIRINYFPHETSWVHIGPWFKFYYGWVEISLLLGVFFFFVISFFFVPRRIKYLYVGIFLGHFILISHLNAAFLKYAKYDILVDFTSFSAKDGT